METTRTLNEWQAGWLIATELRKAGPFARDLWPRIGETITCPEVSVDGRSMDVVGVPITGHSLAFAVEAMEMMEDLSSG